MSKKGKKNILSPEAKQELLIHVRRKLRAIVNLVIYHKRWLEETEDDELGDNVMKNIQLMLVKKKGTLKSLITRKHKTIMLKPLEKRTEEEIEALASVLPSNKFFRKYPPDILYDLAKCIRFHFYPGGRYVYSQNRPAITLYVVLNGETNGLYQEYDPLTHTTNIHTYGHMIAGYAIGIVNVMCEKPRSLTVVTACAAELLSLDKEYFDRYLKRSFRETYMKMAAHYNTFTYLRGWDPEVKRVCSILSKWKVFKPDQIMLSDKCLLKDYAFFIICGVCYMVECLKLNVTYERGQKIYSIYGIKGRKRGSKKGRRSILLDSAPIRKSAEDQVQDEKGVLEGLLKIDRRSIVDDEQMEEEEEEEEELEEEGEEFDLQSNEEEDKQPKQNVSRNFDEESLQTQTTHSDVNMDPKESSGLDTSKMSKSMASKMRHAKKIANTVGFQDRIEHHFIKICDFRALSCFNIGERMENREVIAKTNVHTLLIPQNWLIHQNTNNVWSILIAYLNRTIPNTEKIFNNFVQEQLWRKYKNNMVKQIMEAHVITNTNNRHNIPYCTRLKCPDYFHNN